MNSIRLSGQGRILAILWAVIIGITSLLPSDTLTDIPAFRIPNADKWIHGFSYAVLMFLILKSVSLSGSGKIVKVCVHIFLVVAYGIVLEFLQRFSPGRTFEWWDIVANSAGALFGLIVYILIPNRKSSDGYDDLRE